MKACDELQAWLSTYLDGEAGDQEEAIHAHLGACDVCRRELDGLRRLSRRIRDVAADEPATLVEDIHRQVRDARARRRGRTPIPMLAAAAAILAALLWAVVLVGNGEEEPVRLSDLAAGELSDSEQRILYGQPLTDDEWMAIILSGDRLR